ncbi:MAG: hypothetical protein ACO36E_12380, partial [Synechocystis sp.]
TSIDSAKITLESLFYLKKFINPEWNLYVYDERRNINGNLVTGADAILLAEKYLSYFAGEHIRVVSGPFKDFDGSIMESYPGQKKVKALLSIFGRDTPVDLEWDQLIVEPASEA